ncbi:hypothetical protein [Salinicola aestuarinus]|uniref:hypothetical protein n=1 Tax=Salinicola aestuarinus TaxID=1949082 RepID=UPI000DA1860C|nr:hypothetical protein [Salinicola aestuarinus]
MTHATNRGITRVAARYLPAGRAVLAALVLALAGASVATPALADRVFVVDPQSGKRHYLPDHNGDGRADYVPRHLELNVNPGLVQREYRERDRERSSGGTICHGDDGGTTVSTAKRACDPGAPAGDAIRSRSRSTTSTTTGGATQPSRSSNTQLD